MHRFVLWINYVPDNRQIYGTVDILYGSRSADESGTVKRDPGIWMKAKMSM